MGKVIICNGKTAETPYRFRRSGIYVYSAEELCYYVIKQIETIADEIFSEDLADFLETELCLPERAERFRELLHRKSDVKDMVACVLCSADYCTEEEIKAVLQQIDMLRSLNFQQKKKRTGDNYLKQGKIKEAYAEYRSILQAKEHTELTEAEYGDVLHNLGIVTMERAGFLQAALYFRDAYERNGRAESLQCYLVALIIAGKSDKCEKEAKHYGADVSAVYDMLRKISEEAEHTKGYQEYTGLLMQTASGGKMQALDTMLEEWKQAFRKGYL